MHQRFVLHRDRGDDPGVLAQGVWFPHDNVAVVRWVDQVPAFTVIHDGGMDAVKDMHVAGDVLLVWIDCDDPPPPPSACIDP